MSYILDALRKSQQARQTGAAPGPRGAAHDFSMSLPGAGWLLTAGIVLLFALIVAALYFWRSTAGGIPATAPVEEVPKASLIKTEPVAVEKTPPLLEKLDSIPPLVRGLEEEAKVAVPVIPKKATVVRPPKKAMTKPRPEIAPAIALVTDDTPLLQHMSAELQRALPPMAVTIHVYSPQESQRILFINNREFHRGDQIDGGIRVEDIVPDGVVLSYRGERFKLGRPR
jgi:general secretion pathway protein B